jgi:hypothetical protein
MDISWNYSIFKNGHFVELILHVHIWQSRLKPLILFCDWCGLIKESSRWTRAFATFQFIIYCRRLWNPGYHESCVFKNSTSHFNLLIFKPAFQYLFLEFADTCPWTSLNLTLPDRYESWMLTCGVCK